MDCKNCKNFEAKEPSIIDQLKAARSDVNWHYDEQYPWIIKGEHEFPRIVDRTRISYDCSDTQMLFEHWGVLPMNAQWQPLDIPAFLAEYDRQHPRKQEYSRKKAAEFFKQKLNENKWLTDLGYVNDYPGFSGDIVKGNVHRLNSRIYLFGNEVEVALAKSDCIIYQGTDLHRAWDVFVEEVKREQEKRIHKELLREFFGGPPSIRQTLSLIKKLLDEIIKEGE